jgi:hypothetical protein
LTIFGATFLHDTSIVDHGQALAAVNGLEFEGTGIGTGENFELLVRSIPAGSLIDSGAFVLFEVADLGAQTCLGAGDLAHRAVAQRWFGER